MAGALRCIEIEARVGPSNDRPSLAALMTDLRRRRFDVLVVWALDRLARS